jgi:hypothetical protein
VSVRFEVQGQPPAGTEIDGIWFAASRLSGGIIPCAHWSVLVGCGVAQLGAWFGSTDAPNSKTGAALYGAGGGRVGVELVALNWLTVTAFGDLLGALERPAFVLDEKRRWIHFELTGAIGAQALAFF